MSAGSWALITGSGQAIPTTSWADIDMGSITTDADSILSESAGVFTPQSEGYYLIIPEAQHQITHNNRHNWEMQLHRNGAAVAGAINSGYARNNNNDLSWAQLFAIQHFNGTTDTFKVQHRREVGDGTPAGTYDWTRVKVIQLTEGAASATPFGHYGTPTSAALGGTTPTATSGWDVITETDDTVLELQAGGSDIRCKVADRPVLLVYGLPSDAAGGSRTGRISDVTLDGARIAHSVDQEYCRDAGTDFCAPAGIALAVPDAADEDLNVRVWGHTGPGWGTWVDANWSLSSAAGRAGIMALALPADVDYAIWEHTTGGTSIAGAGVVDLPQSDVAVSSNGSKFTRDDADDVTVPGAHGVLAVAAMLAERTAASGTRHTFAVRFEREGVDESDTAQGDYLRGDQGSADHYNASACAVWVGDTTAGDTFQLEKYDPGTDDGANDVLEFAGSFYLDLSTLASSPPSSVDGSGRAGLLGSLRSAVSTARDVLSRAGALASGRSAATSARTAVARLGGLVAGRATGTRTEPIMIVDSTHVTNLEATTAQLTSPGGTFTAGDVLESQRLTGDIDPAADGYTEVEVSLEAFDLADGMEVELRLVLEDGTPFDTYTAIPKWTVGTTNPAGSGRAAGLASARAAVTTARPTLSRAGGIVVGRVTATKNIPAPSRAGQLVSAQATTGRSADASGRAAGLMVGRVQVTRSSTATSRGAAVAVARAAASSNYTVVVRAGLLAAARVQVTTTEAATGGGRAGALVVGRGSGTTARQVVARGAVLVTSRGTVSTSRDGQARAGQLVSMRASVSAVISVNAFGRAGLITVARAVGTATRTGVGRAAAVGAAGGGIVSTARPAVSRGAGAAAARATGTVNENLSGKARGAALVVGRALATVSRPGSGRGSTLGAVRLTAARSAPGTGRGVTVASVRLISSRGAGAAGRAGQLVTVRVIGVQVPRIAGAGRIATLASARLTVSTTRTGQAQAVTLASARGLGAKVRHVVGRLAGLVTGRVRIVADLPDLSTAPLTAEVTETGWYSVTDADLHATVVQDALWSVTAQDADVAEEHELWSTT